MSYVREDYLSAMGIVSWQRRQAAVKMLHYSGVSRDHQWLLLASVDSVQQDSLKLARSIGRLLSITEIHTKENITLEALSSVSVQRLLLLGDEWRELFSLEPDVMLYQNMHCIVGPSLEAMLSQPVLKQQLWQQLKPVISQGAKI